MVELPSASRAAAVAEYVEDLIVNTALSAGDRIAGKAELQERLRVARSTVGEAIKILQDRGLITVKSGPGGGIFVATTDHSVRIKRLFIASRGDASRANDAMELRDHLEPLVLRDAAKYRSAEDLEQLRVLLDAAGADPDNLTLTLQRIWAVHRRIGEITPNYFLRSTYLGLIDVLESHLGAPAHPPAGMDARTFSRQRIDTHRELVAAIESADPDRLTSALTRHESHLAIDEPG
ncbi:FadR/GntR family transcriptional regulator [Microbacterium caowuchunii]|uniref:FadR family transcriptional regulator n=1 Tax=Microbacterium caowuchunii TaxID=2614638 RepID=A0A5N0TH58_9MICO|nr:FCD domain-containing protein [Microbacterium caowuchunii]KAA9134410.1 FadR family transcriptional regulator [Microbacterium caowuchunii]